MYKPSKQLPAIHVRPITMHKMISTEEWMKKQEEIKQKEERRKLKLATPKSEGTLKVYFAKPRTEAPLDKRRYWKRYYARNKDKIKNYQRERYNKNRCRSDEPDYQI
jgi:hypothetical protein